ncbi:MAG: isochorismatase family protein [Aminobacterium sp.]|jgi:nicotinamidase-related amidase|uniref:Isochorismatase-like domain-containing protein n=1 Tax=bioreactor metagenome TaxID=1076179 RepID=A0A645G6Z6_9ZZZZ|nr:MULTISPECIES: isochorismatase family protein [unclassified Aminobacterium]MDD2206095.1 isochorismatase family protein [Aminobacterium sp.]MDD3426759.1 isochorismatase family protein [Aminobacterium sp.]MDD3707814.1 isochorismatase family protein [Aminobacterium sp.]MDD4228061.1 isochorismatase family protein [Aminobacterium sp.]MDD4551092.1 isochorismatase family protein [Aminobacterium sp.]
MSSLKLSCENTQFLMIDIQERLLPAIDHSENVKANAFRLLEGARTLHIPVTYTEQYPKGLGPTDSLLLEKLEGIDSFQKTTFSCCDEEGFINVLKDKKRSNIVVWGIESHICVLATIMDILSHDFTVWLAADASGSRNTRNHDLALQAMSQMGVIVVPTETILYQLMKRAGTPEFKTLLPLFK